MFYKSWYESGIVTFDQIIEDNGCLKSCQQLQNLFSKKINIIEYKKLYNAIPKEWYSIIKHNIQTEVEIPASLMVKETIKCSKLLYDKLRDCKKFKTNNRNVRNRWEQLLNQEIRDQVWEKMYKTVISLTLSTKLRFFQYRIMNMYLTTNVTVAKWDRNIKPNCTFCQEHEETTMHLFVTCDQVQKLWKSLFRWLDYFCYVNLDIEPVSIIFNCYKVSFSDMINTIVLITKYYVYAQRTLGNKLNFKELIAQISQYKRIEEISARSSGKSEKHDKKWHMYNFI